MLPGTGADDTTGAPSEQQICEYAPHAVDRDHHGQRRVQPNLLHGPVDKSKQPAPQPRRGTQEKQDGPCACRVRAQHEPRQDHLHTANARTRAAINSGPYRDAPTRTRAPRRSSHACCAAPQGPVATPERPSPDVDARPSATRAPRSVSNYGTATAPAPTTSCDRPSTLPPKPSSGAEIRTSPPLRHRERHHRQRSKPSIDLLQLTPHWQPSASRCRRPAHRLTKRNRSVKYKIKGNSIPILLCQALCPQIVTNLQHRPYTNATSAIVTPARAWCGCVQGRGWRGADEGRGRPTSVVPTFRPGGVAGSRHATDLSAGNALDGQLGDQVTDRQSPAHSRTRLDASAILAVEFQRSATMPAKPRFVQFSHPGREHGPGTSRHQRLRTSRNGRRRNCMQPHGR